MSFRGLFPVGMVVLAAAIALAADKPGPGAPAEAANEVQDLLFLGDNRPMRLRLHVRIDGQPFERRWDEYMRRIFDFCDLNGDGWLSKEEAARVPSASFLQSHLSGALVVPSGDNVAPWADLDLNPPDGKVTLEKLKAYYRHAGFGPLQVQPAPGQGASQELTDALFKALDTNKDGKLSKEEIQNAAEVLAKFDFDEDEMVAADELVPTINGLRFGFARRAPTDATTADVAFVTLPPGETPVKATARLIRKYDKDHDGKLSKDESGFDDATFARLDANKDGKLDAAELAKWFAEPANLELIARLGTAPKDESKGVRGPLEGAAKMLADSGLEVFNPDTRTIALASSLHKKSDGLLLALDNALIEMRREDQAPQSPTSPGVRGFYLQQFRTAAGDKKVLEKKDAADNQFLAGVFALMDRNGDGKLTEAEVTEFLDVHALGSTAFVTLTQGDQGRGLFELIDTNRDGRLSPRELKNAWKTLEPWDLDGDGCISRNEIPRRLQLIISHGRPASNSPAAAPAVSPVVSKARAGPLWFRKMDRNGDGDVSRKEFLGTDEDFDRIDTDHDGLISEKEAVAADEWFRKKLESSK
jgi:Ca2+-binding EF-hand superfamily protein